MYEDKIKTMSYVDSSKLIPLLISVSRKKQGNEKLNWGNWLKIPENRYLSYWGIDSYEIKAGINYTIF